MAAPDPRPRRRHVDRRAGLAKVNAEGRCRLCGAGWPLSRHHVVPRSLGGSDVDDNLVPLCGDGTTGCHGRIENGHHGARAALYRSLTAAELAYADGRKYDGWCEDYYGGRRVEA